MLTKQTAFWPIRTQLSVRSNHYKESIHELKTFIYLKKKKKKKKVGSLLPFTHPSISYKN